MNPLWTAEALDGRFVEFHDDDNWSKSVDELTVELSDPLPDCRYSPLVEFEDEFGTCILRRILDDILDAGMDVTGRHTPTFCLLVNNLVAHETDFFNSVDIDSS